MDPFIIKKIYGGHPTPGAPTKYYTGRPLNSGRDFYASSLIIEYSTSRPKYTSYAEFVYESLCIRTAIKLRAIVSVSEIMPFFDDAWPVTNKTTNIQFRKIDLHCDSANARHAPTIAQSIIIITVSCSAKSTQESLVRTVTVFVRPHRALRYASNIWSAY